MADWKETCNLPRTAFAMKANLQTSEPEAVARWKAMNLYAGIRRARAGDPVFVYHDGPPYANGQIHLGTALNKTLKDFVIKSRNMLGFDTPFVPGWDCHGLPIELRVDRELGPKKREMTVAEFRRECRAYAEKYVGIQRADFERLGIFGTWDSPYLTMNYGYQAAIVRALGRFVAQGLVYKSKKPVHWCMHCRTALAEAEVEYEPHTSPSIYVEFPLKDESRVELAARTPELGDRSVSVLIWTTTPWTIPANLAVAFHPDFEYGLYNVGGRAVVVAAALAAQVSAKVRQPFGEPIATLPGRAFEGLRFEHPLYARESLGVLGDYVTLEAGTGAVHTAPGHGADDYYTGVKYGLDIYGPLDPGGHYLETVELFAGQQVLDANPAIEAALAARGRLWQREDYDHSYPHCWRCHNPVIFLATPQWFITMEGEQLRQRALDAIDRTQWIPPWGRDRIFNMIAHRPDWCISRQRSWGVPIPALDCARCGQAVLTTELCERAAQVFETHGADAWWERDAAEFIPEGLTCSACGNPEFVREFNILDVWFDSGSSHEAVLPFAERHHWPADLYLEGSDQHRGWFHSSLLVGIGTRGDAPFKAVLTHGFVVDEHGRKMSKSLGNNVEPQAIIAQSGAEILRLWVAMVDYREDIRFGKEILARTVEAYRKVRNVVRVLTANLYDFDPAVDALPRERMLELDRYMMARYADAAARIVRAYEEYDFAGVFQIANQLITVDISAFYVDVSKDRMYTWGAVSEGRRSGQTTMYALVEGLARLLAPILPFTMDELWRALPGERAASVHMATFPRELESWVDPELLVRWQSLSTVRDRVNAALEEKRKDKTIAANLSAHVTLSASGPLAALLEQSRDELPTIFGVSQVTLAGAAASGQDAESLEVRVSRAEGIKCERCWRYVPAVSTQPEFAGICDRCVGALAEAVSR